MATTILHLPDELLGEVFSHLGSPNIIRDAEPGQFDWRGDGQDGRIFRDGKLEGVKSARLTCRRFNEAASPFLLATIRVRVDQRSLDRVQAIVGNPLVASGIRCVKVDLSVYPWEVAETLESFTDRQSHDVTEMDQYDGVEGARYPRDPGCLISDEVCLVHDHCRARDIEDYIESILHAWDVKPGAEAPSVSSGYPDYRATLIAAYDKFKAMYEEQEDLIGSGEYLDRMADWISILPRFGALRFDSGDDKLQWDPQTTFYHQDRFLEFLSAPYTWEDAEDMSDASSTVELGTSHLLCDLPIKIHRVGKTIRSLIISCFPALLDNLPPIDIFHFEKSFRAAFQSLEAFRLISSPRECIREYEGLGADTVGGISDRYIAAVISAPSLRELDLSSEIYDITLDSCPSGTVLSAVTSQNLDALTLFSVILREPDLEHLLCKSLSDSPRLVQLTGVTLSEGSWARGIDVLRRKTEARCAERTCSVGVDRLIGGEFTGVYAGISMRDWRSVSGVWPVGPPLATGHPYRPARRFGSMFST